MKVVVVVAPHPDDETLGCGGALLRHVKEGDFVHWLIATRMTEEAGFTSQKISERKEEIASIAKAYKFTSVTQLEFSSKSLDEYPRSEVVSKFSEIFRKLNPQYLYIPFYGDSHSDHKIVYEAVSACTKWFRFPSIQKVMAYETISETESALPNAKAIFAPNLFVNIEQELSAKIEIMKMYKGEMGEFPFPRSAENIKNLAGYRGASAGFKAAEAFMTLKELY